MQVAGHMSNQSVSTTAPSASAETVFINITEGRSQIRFKIGKLAYSMNKTSRD